MTTEKNEEAGQGAPRTPDEEAFKRLLQELLPELRQLMERAEGGAPEQPPRQAPGNPGTA